MRDLNLDRSTLTRLALNTDLGANEGGTVSHTFQANTTGGGCQPLLFHIEADAVVLNLQNKFIIN